MMRRDLTVEHEIDITILAEQAARMGIDFKTLLKQKIKDEKLHCKNEIILKIDLLNLIDYLVVDDKDGRVVVVASLRGALPPI